MVEHNPLLTFITHALLIAAIAAVGFPIYYAIAAATQTLQQVNQSPMSLVPGTNLIANVHAALNQGNALEVLKNTFIMAAGVTVGKIAISILSAFSVVYFKYRGRMVAFWLIFITLMLPVEVRILPTYEVATNVLAPVNWVMDWLHLPELANLLGFRLSIGVKWSILDSYSGLILPLIASATATFVFRQFFLTIPDELAEAAKMDGAGPMRFFWSILVPMSRTNVAALVVILFLYGWNQYLWPLLITTDPHMRTAMIQVRYLIPPPDSDQTWNIVMTSALIMLIPPALVVTVMQRWFVKGLIEGEK